MGRVLAVVAGALLLCFAILGVVVYVNREEDRVAVDNLLAENLSRAIGTAEEDTGGRVALPEIADFAWDEVLLVAPRTPRAAISEELGYEWKGDVNFGVSETLIFLLRGKLARFADYRGLGVFDGFPRPFARIPRSRAVLKVRNLLITP